VQYILINKCAISLHDTDTVDNCFIEVYTGISLFLIERHSVVCIYEITDIYRHK